MPDLTTRLLAEIERREDDKRPLDGRMSTAGANVTVRRELAYLAALRKVVELHRLFEWDTYRDTPCCARCTAGGEYPADDEYSDEHNWPCPTLEAVAGCLGVDVG